MSNKEWWFNQKWYSEKEVVYLKNWEYEKQNEIFPELRQITDKLDNIGLSTLKGENYYTLKVLTAMPFEQWARLIEIENINNNDRN